MTTRRQHYADLTATMAEPHRKAVRYHLDAQRQVADIARTVVAHPGWQIYLDHVDANLEALGARQKALESQIAKGDELGDALAALKLRLRDVTGEIRGWQGAKAVVPQMIEAGDRAVESLAGLEP